MDVARFAGERLSYDETAKLIGVKASTIRCWVSAESYDFPRGVKVGNKRFFLKSEIEAWLEKRRDAI